MRQPISGVEQSYVMASTDPFSRRRPRGAKLRRHRRCRALRGRAAAEELVAPGLAVNYVTRLPMLAPGTQWAGRTGRFSSAGKPFRHLVRTRAITVGSADVLSG